MTIISSGLPEANARANTEKNSIKSFSKIDVINSFKINENNKINNFRRLA